MSAPTLPKTVTYEEWLEMPEVEDGREEVVDGEIIRLPPNKWNHAQTIEELADVLRRQLPKKEVWVVTSNFGLVIRREPLTSRTPDLAVIRRSTLVEQDGYIHSAPELIVEVLSPSNTRRQMEHKIRDYESIGVPELWILSGEARTFEVFQLQDGKLRRTQLLAEGELRPKCFPEAVVDIASVWPD
jgi:Uma2 family endonuclease